MVEQAADANIETLEDFVNSEVKRFTEGKEIDYELLTDDVIGTLEYEGCSLSGKVETEGRKRVKEIIAWYCEG